MEYKITNYRPPINEMSSSEYIKKTHSNLNITKTHGLGSGVYGVIKDNLPFNDRAGRELETNLVLYKPVIIRSDEELGDYITLSTFVAEIVESLINSAKVDNVDEKARMKASANARLSSEEGKIIKEILKHLAPNANLIEGIKSFLTAYNKAKIGDFVHQPMNYILKLYDGIYNDNNNGNTFSMGSVKFIDVNPRHQKGKFDMKPYIEPGNNLIEIRGGKKTKKSRKMRKSKKTKKTRKNRKEKRKSKKSKK